MQGQNSRKCKQIQASRDNNSQKAQLEKTCKQYDIELLYNTQLSTQNQKTYTTPVHKQLAESLILSKLHYCDELFDIPKYIKE